MTERLVRATFKRQATDGAYGSETIELALEDVVAEGDDEEDAAVALMMQARRLVQAELARSPSARVRGSVATTHPQPPIATGRPVPVPMGPPEPPDDDGDEPWR